MKFAAKKNPTVLAGFFFRAKFHSNSLYVVEKKIVGISQYPYFSSSDLGVTAVIVLVLVLTTKYRSITYVREIFSARPCYFSSRQLRR
jgi:hypothetical protein